MTEANDFGWEECRMSIGEVWFLGMVICTFAAFAAVLAVIGWSERSWAKKNGK
jgi:hypothetical protein